MLQRFGEVVVGDLQVVLGSDGLRVADLLADDVHGEVVRQFGLAGAAKVLEQLWPSGRTDRSRGVVR